jgi:hypothetical protein
MAQVLTARNSVIAARQVALIQANMVDNTAFFDPPIKGVSYGDQDKIPAYPWVCVEPNDKERMWPPTPTDQTDVILETYIYVYYAVVTQSDPINRQRADELSEAVEEYFNVWQRRLKDANGNDLVVYGYCIKNESGYVRKETNRVKSARITWRGRSKLPLTLAQ